MAAGLAGMTQVLTPERSRDLNQRGDRLREGLNGLFARRGAPLRATGLGSVMNLHAGGRSERRSKDQGSCLLRFDCARLLSRAARPDRVVAAR